MGSIPALALFFFVNQILLLAHLQKCIHINLLVGAATHFELKMEHLYEY